MDDFFETETLVEVQIKESGNCILIALDGETFALSFNDARKVAESLLYHTTPPTKR